MEKIKIISSLLVVFVLFVGVVLAETRYYVTIPGWGETNLAGSDVLSKTSTYPSYTAYYALVNLRAWGSVPNPLKDESQKTCYNCQATSQANVWNGYFGNKTAKHFMGYTVSGGTNYETTYTSNGGYDSNYSCWANGC